LAAVLIVTASGGLGARIYCPVDIHPLTRAALQAAVGLGILSLSTLLVGSFYLRAWLIWVALAVILITLHGCVFRWLKEFKGLGELLPPSARFSWLLAVLIGLLFITALITALAPPLKFDALMYHLVMPSAYLREGRVSYLPWIAMSGMPQNAEMLYTWAIALAGSSGAATLSWAYSLLAVMGLAGYLKQKIGLPAAWVAPAALLAGSTLALSPAYGYVDWLALLFGLGMLVCLDQWRLAGRRLDLVIAGVFAGLALGTKYPAGVLGLVGLVTLAWHCRARRAAFLPAVFQFGLAGALVALPWFLKNWFTTGNPIYPFFFSGGAMTAVRQAIYQGTPPFGNLLDLFLLPLRATQMGVEGAGGYSVSIGPLLLGLGALAWFGWRSWTEEQRSLVQTASIITITGLLVWAIGNQMSGFLIQTRFYFALFPAFAVLASFGYQGLTAMRFPGVRIARIVNALLLLVLCLNLLETSIHTLQQGSLQFVLGKKDQEAYLAENLGWFQPGMKVIRDLPEGSKVLLLFETRSLYCAPKCFPDEILDRWKRTLTETQDPSGIITAWKNEGYTHILFYRSGAQFMQESGDPHYQLSDWLALDEFLQYLPPPVDFDGVYQLYTLP
jgi:hypothetical protein